MTCMKTGAVAYLKEYDELVRGDLFVVGGLYILRCNNKSREHHSKILKENLPGYSHVHLVINSYAHWFDARREDQTSTLVCTQHKVRYFGSNGMELRSFLNPGKPEPIVEDDEADEPIERKGPPDGEKDQLDYTWNEPGAPFRSSNY